MDLHNFVMKGPVIFSLLVLVSADPFDDIADKMASVDASNCHEKTKDDLTLSLTFGKDQDSIIEAKNLALTRAFVFTVTNQKLNTTYDFVKQPDLVYHYLSSATAVSSSYWSIVGAGLYYDQHTAYPNWYHSVPFNVTLNLFAPYAMRDLNHNKGDRDLQKFKVKDDSVRNYTTSASKTSDWFRLWLPDQDASMDSVNKGVFTVTDNYDYSYVSFYGVKTLEPVLVTAPYFDCGRTDNWIVTAAAPIVDYLTRYSFWAYLRRPRFVAVSTVDVDFTYVDVNPCDISADNPYPNIFAGTHKCKASTDCRALKGHGFSRDGYECVCKPGYVYPSNNPGPYTGKVLEEASAAEYADGFECVLSTDGAGRSHVQISTDDDAILQRIDSVSSSDCSSTSIPFTLPENVRLQSHFEPQYAAVVRLAQFLSSVLQTSFDPGSNLRSMKNLNNEEIFSEVAAIVLADDKVAAAEVVVKTNTDGNEEINSMSVKAKEVEANRLTLSDVDLEVEVDAWTEEMFNQRKNSVWTGTFEHKEFTVDPLMKAGPNAGSLKQMSPWNFIAPVHSNAIWSPEYSCVFGQWTFNLTMPILGLTDTGNGVEFRGETSVQILVPTSVLRETSSEG